jgi:Flp pilus assembly pilin Flp
MPHPPLTHLKPSDERGQTMAEYALLVGLVAVVMAATVTLIGASILNLFRAAGALLGG